jgi:putative transposase
VRSRIAVSERRACRIVGQARTTQRRRPFVRDDDAALTAAIDRLASRYGRYGYRRIGRMLVAEGWQVNVKRVWRIWRREGLKVPSKQPKRGRLWLNDGSCLRLRPGYGLTTCCTALPTCSSHSTSGPTIAPSSQPRRFDSGLAGSA